MPRTFTVNCVYSSTGRKLSFTGGRYVSEIPANAARKAFSQLTQNKKGRVSLEIYLRETTQNSSHKVYKYKVSRINKKTEVNHNGTTVVYKYITKVKAF